MRDGVDKSDISERMHFCPDEKQQPSSSALLILQRRGETEKGINESSEGGLDLDEPPVAEDLHHIASLRHLSNRKQKEHVR
jgi:hypothetical protein